MKQLFPFPQSITTPLSHLPCEIGRQLYAEARILHKSVKNFPVAERMPEASIGQEDENDGVFVSFGPYHRCPVLLAPDPTGRCLATSEGWPKACGAHATAK
jgi:hypothetical protein